MVTERIQVMKQWWYVERPFPWPYIAVVVVALAIVVLSLVAVLT